MSVSATSIASLDACAQVELVRTGEVSALELTDAAIERIERLNPILNAVVSFDFDQARRRARVVSKDALFGGVPTLIKDVLPYPGLPLGMGGRFLPQFPMPSGSPYTDALDAAGLVVLGKSATSEFALLGTTEPVGGNPVRNPWNLSLSSGGSSGGAVAAVASGMVPIAHASDGGGSIRGPSSFCGLFGFKPSRGRTQSNGLPESSPSVQFLSEHCVSRSVRDSLAWLQATERQDNDQHMPSLDELRANRRPFRIGVYRNDGFGNAPDPDAAAGLELAMRTCEALGHSVVEISSPPIDTKAASEAFFTLSASMVAGGLEFFRSMLGSAYNEDNLEPYTRELAKRARAMPQEACIRALETLSSAAAVAKGTMAGFDVLLCPTVGFPAFELGRYTPDKDVEELNAFIVRVASYTFPASLAGWPAMSMPLYWTHAGLPLGSHFSAAAGNDALLFSLALQLEEALPWQPRFSSLMDRLYAATA